MKPEDVLDGIEMLAQTIHDLEEHDTKHCVAHPTGIKRCTEDKCRLARQIRLELQTSVYRRLEVLQEIVEIVENKV